jgi:hypothetical protein
MSPDGSLVAAAGYTGWDWDRSCHVYLFETGSGRLLRRLTGFSSTLNDVAFSRDGRRLVGAMASQGVRVVRVPDGQELAKDAAYSDESYGADFDRVGRLVTSCWDGWLRLYDANGTLLVKVQVGSRPHGVRFSPDGGRVAVGYLDGNKVEVRSAADLSLLFAPDVSKVDANLGLVAWSADGQTLYAGGRFENPDGGKLVRAWPQGGRGAWKDHLTGHNTLRSLTPLPDGRLAWGSSDPSWGILDGFSKGNAKADFRDMGEHFTVDAVSSRVSFGFATWGKNPATFDLGARLMSAGAAANLVQPRTSAPSVTVTDWRNETSPKLNSTALSLKKYETSRCIALDGKGGLLLGADWHLYAFDAKGVERWSLPAPDVAWAVNVTPDGALGVVAYGDGTIRWHRMTDGKELLALFPHLDGRRWVAWTPSGYYDCSPGGEDLIGWHVNHGKDQAADFYSASRFRGQFYRPDVVARVLAALDEGAAVILANEAGNRTQAASVQALLPPSVRILSPDNGTRYGAGPVSLRASVRNPGGGPVDAVWATVDGRRVETRGITVQAGTSQDGGKVYTLEVPMPAQDCAVSVFAQSGSAVSEAAVVRLAWAGARPQAPAAVPGTAPAPAPAPPAFVAKPKLYVLAVGVGAYQLADLKLDFPAKDARDLSHAFSLQKGRLFREVEVKLITDAEATRDNVMDGLDWLEHEVTAKDVAVMFLAGHGINDNSGQYYFLPVNADPQRIKRTMVADSDVRSTLAKLPGKVLFFLDTCHSGNVLGGAKQRGHNDLNGFINELSSAENGVVVFAASTGKQGSQESREWQNGAFTKAVVEGLSGKADFQHTGRITVNMLDLYVSERVKVLTHGTQAPTTAKPATVPDFPLAVD